MPAEVGEPLEVVFTLPGGVVYRRRLDDLPNQVLAADLAVGLAASAHPHGPIRTRSVASHYATTIRRMVRELHAAGFGGGLGELTPAGIVRYWLTCDYPRERHIRQVLDGFQSEVGGLHPGVVAHLEGRRINKLDPGTPNQPYSEAEWRRLTAACLELITVSYRAHTEALTAAGRGTDPVGGRVNRDNLAWLVLAAGPVPAGTLVRMLGPEVRSRADRAQVVVRRQQVAALRRALFIDGDTVLAYKTLLAMRTGIVPDGINTLTLANITRTGPASVLLSYFKGRTGGEALNLPGDAVRLLDRWLAHSGPLREHASARSDDMWIYTDDRRSARDLVLSTPRNGHARKRLWQEKVGLLGDDGQSLAVHGGRIRATYHHRRDRSTWTGRTTIDPNHSAQVEGDHYLSSHTPAQMDAIEAVIEQAQHDVRRKAEPAVIVTSESAARFAAAFPRLVEEAGLDTAAITALLAGEQDVFVAACASPFNSPHAAAGTLCPARPWVCLLCPLAAFAPRHLPGLLALREFFSRQAMQLTTAQFLGVFGPYSARLTEDILPRFGASAIAQAARQLAEQAAELPLHLEEVPA